jgi:6-phosphogluconolactonase
MPSHVWCQTGWPIVRLALLAGLLQFRPSVQAETPMLRTYLGTYTRGTSQGIYTGELKLEGPQAGELSGTKLAATAVNPSFVAVHPNQQFLYAVGEIDDAGAGKGGGVTAFAIQPGGTLKQLNQQSSGGAGPCHLVVDATGKNVLVANYGGGSAACLPIRDDGTLGEATSFVQHQGSSVNPQRQEKPHAHSVNLDPANRFAIVADLGLDKLLVYKFDAEKGTLTPNDPPYVELPAGGGPRHFAFHPNGKFAFANNEMASSVTALSYDPARGAFTVLETLSTLPKDFSGNNSTAETRVHPNGKFLYVSNRGHDSIAIFSIDPSTGRLKALGHESTRGKTPRNFNLDPSGNYLLAANQDSDNVVVFRVDPKTGLLTAGEEIKVGSPCCVRFLTNAPTSR